MALYVKWQDLWCAIRDHLGWTYDDIALTITADDDYFDQRKIMRWCTGKSNFPRRDKISDVKNYTAAFLIRQAEESGSAVQFTANFLKRFENHYDMSEYHVNEKIGNSCCKN